MNQANKTPDGLRYLDATREKIIQPANFHDLAVLIDYEPFLDFYNWHKRYYTHVLLTKRTDEKFQIIEEILGVYDNLNTLAKRIREEILFDNNNVRETTFEDYLALSMEDHLYISGDRYKPTYHCYQVLYNETRPGQFTIQRYEFRRTSSDTR